MLLEIAPHVAMMIDAPEDNKLQQMLFDVVAGWVPGYGGRKHSFAISEYERMHLMMSLKFISKLYKASTIELFYIPLFSQLIADELKGDSANLGAKLQLAEVFHEFILNVIPENENRVFRSDVTEEQIYHAQCNIIDCYSQLIAPEQNKEAMARAIKDAQAVILVFEDPAKHMINPEVADYFDKKFKK